MVFKMIKLIVMIALLPVLGLPILLVNMVISRTWEEWKKGWETYFFG